MANPIKPNDLAALYRQLAALTNAGVSPTVAADAIATAERTSTASRTFGSIVTRRVMEAIRYRTSQGLKLSQAMAEWPQIFPRLHLLVVDEGEMTGQVDKALTRLALITERDIEFRNEIRRISIFPRIFLNIGLPALLLAFLCRDASMVPWWAIVVLVVSFALLRSMGFLVASVQGQTHPRA